ncbi:hypothetical protein OCE50_27795 [Bacillus wiedmannii]|uniref:hypothetical protein n=1 Tax=Bacillus wiedmannii TaxID=1890302 RepID=UPI0021D0DCB9|nr:hypothetical protein [Bacillus wiedmannii]MCU5414671.1 hypothetical protein [Bacillus wiedmannii]
MDICIENTHAYDEQGNKVMLRIEHYEISSMDYYEPPESAIEILEILHFPIIYKCWGKGVEK